MAIQVNGTQVIGNSRELTNITSVDATTVAAFGAAGVGGGNLSVTATGAITAGRTVSLNSDGTVSQTAGEYYLDDILPTEGTYYDSNMSNLGLGFWYHFTTGNHIDGDGETFIHAFQTGTGNYLYAQAFTYNSSTRTVTHGTPVGIYTGTDGTGLTIVYDSGQDAWLLSYAKGSDGYVRVATVSGTTITLGSETSTGLGLGKRELQNMSYDPYSNYVIGSYYKPSSFPFRLLSINASNRTVSVGSELTAFPTLSQGYVNLRFMPLPELNRVACFAAYSTDARLNSFSVNNINSVSFATELSATTPGEVLLSQNGINPIYVPAGTTGGTADTGIYFLLAANNGTVYYSLYKFSSTTVTQVHNFLVITKTGIGPYGNTHPLANTGWCDPTSKAIRFNSREQDNGNGSYVFKYLIQSDGKLTDSSSPLSWTPYNDNWAGGRAHPINPETGALYAYSSSNDDKIQILQTEFGSTNVTEFIGFSSGSYTNGQTASIDILGSVNTGQSGLTIGKQYFVAANGDLAESPVKDTGNFRQEAGKSLSATSILVKG